jgi:hypothetical protein
VPKGGRRSAEQGDSSVVVNDRLRRGGGRSKQPSFVNLAGSQPISGSPPLRPISPVFGATLVNRKARILAKLAANLRRNWEKGEPLGELRLQVSLLACCQVRRSNSRQRDEWGRVMRFLIKAAFWLTIVALLLPGNEKQSTASEPYVGATEAVTAAGAAVSDMRQFCARQPDACTVGSHAAAALGQKAQSGAKRLYEFLHDRLGPNETGSVAATAPERPAASAPSQHTLTPSDLAPTWRGPEPRRDPRRPA